MPSDNNIKTEGIIARDKIRLNSIYAEFIGKYNKITSIF
jgi:hypothetical protein